MYTNVDTLHNKKAELMTRTYLRCMGIVRDRPYDKWVHLVQRPKYRRGVSLYVKDNLRSNEVKTVSHIRSICVVFSTAY